MIFRYRRGEEAVPDHRCGQRRSLVQGGDDDLTRQVSDCPLFVVFSKRIIVLNSIGIPRLHSGGKFTLSPRNVEIEITTYTKYTIHVEK